jgi:iron complex transport system permease protein
VSDSSRGAGAARFVLLAAILAVAMLVAVRVGAAHFSTAQVIQAIRGDGDATTVAIVRRLRLPRAVLAGLAGGSLALSGAVFQALLRNPLAEPYVLGVSGGAAVGAVLVISVFGLTASSGLVAVAAFAGAAGAVALVFRIAAGAGRALDTRVLLLAGVVCGALFNALILLVLTFADPDSFRSAVFWMMGSFSGATWGGVSVLALAAAPAIAVLLALARPLDLLSLGEETAAVLGVNTERTKLLAFATASLLTGAAVAVSGVIGFVGLVIPHVVRLLWGGDHRRLLPASILLGASFLVLMDALARTVAAPTELPVGAVTALTGVPFFVYLLRRRAA